MFGVEKTEAPPWLFQRNDPELLFLSAKMGKHGCVIGLVSFSAVIFVWQEQVFPSNNNKEQSFGFPVLLHQSYLVTPRRFRESSYWM